jgi:hypothetical protein
MVFGFLCNRICRTDGGKPVDQSVRLNRNYRILRVISNGPGGPLTCPLTGAAQRARIPDVPDPPTRWARVTYLLGEIAGRVYGGTRQSPSSLTAQRLDGFQGGGAHGGIDAEDEPDGY